MTLESPALLRIALPVPLRRHFDYLPPQHFNPEQLQPGIRMSVPFRKRELVGIYLGLASASSVAGNKLKQVIEIIDTRSILSADILKLCAFATDYYHHPLGDVLANALPVLLRQGKPAVPQKIRGKRSPFMPIESHALQLPLLLNTAQQQAVDTIIAGANQFHVFLLDGVTGSGKTEVYLQAMTHTLAYQQQVLVLIPEIGLTPQTIQRFRERFSVPIVALHSGLSEKERLNAWLQAKSGEAAIVIGTRSAVFADFHQLGLIIVDEEHDLSFKQQEGFRYHARDLAIMRAHFNKIPIVLGSATPSLETLYNAEQRKYVHLSLPERAGGAQLPHFQVLDIRNIVLEQGLAPQLITEIKATLARGEQVMLFLNRRGFAPVLMCHGCGWMALCKRCDMRMTYHHAAGRLHCHHCESQKKAVIKCEACAGKELHALGLGTERLEDILTSYFPEASIARIDRDSTQRKGALAALLQEIEQGKHQILIGTQMLAKGHHFPNVTLVAIVDADGGFFSADFRALERMGQLLLQVAGRAGRVEKKGKVIIQTRHPQHPLLFFLLQNNYSQFAMALLQERSHASLPPYVFFALFRAEAYSAEYANDFLTEIKQSGLNLSKNMIIQGPIPAVMPRRAGRHRAQLLICAKQRSHLQHFLKELLPCVEKISNKKRVRWSLDVDPMEMF